MALLTFTLTHGGVGAHKTPTWVSSYSIPPVVYNPALLYVHVNQEGLEYICLGGVEAHLCDYGEAFVLAG